MASCAGEESAREVNKSRSKPTHLVQRVANNFRVLEADVLLDELAGREELVARLAAELALLFLLDERAREAVELLLARVAAKVSQVERRGVSQQRDALLELGNPASLCGTGREQSVGAGEETVRSADAPAASLDGARTVSCRRTC